MKYCPRCQTEVPIAGFHKNKNRPDGLSAWCKSCRLSDLKAKYVPAPPRVSPYPPGFKKCHRCDTVRPLDDFGRSSASKDGRQARCRGCQTELAKEWNKANRDRVREIDRDRYRRHKTKRLALSKACRQANLEQSRARDRGYNRKRYKADPDAMKEKTKRWERRNPEKVKALRGRSNAARRARLLNAPGSHTKEERRELCASYSHLCVYCNSPVVATELDHITPLAGGGCDHIDNLVPACGKCNASKCNRPLLRFLMIRSGF